MIPVRSRAAAHDTLEMLFRLYLSSYRFLPEDSPEFLQIADDADKIGKVDGTLRSEILSRLYALTGNRDKADYYLENARRLHISENAHDLAQLTMLLSLGYCSEAVPILEKCGDPERGLLNVFLLSPPGNGIYHLLQEFHKKAVDMALTNVPDFPDAFADAVQIMDEWGDTDRDYAAALDVAGAIMRERKLFFTGEGLNLFAVLHPGDGSPSYNKLSYTVDVDFDSSLDMTLEYADRLAASGIKIPQSMIFEFIPHTHEHHTS